MSEDLIINSQLSKKERYELLLPQVEALISGEKNRLANQANLCAAIKESFRFLWIGFYHVDKEELVLGTFQGPVACTRIKKGRGVCGTSWEKGETIIVDDVELFPGHISCNSKSRSEIVIPIFNKEKKVISVFDIDHTEKGFFDEIDQIYLERMVALID